MKIGRWKVSIQVGWFKGDPPCGFIFEFFNIIEDYPKGWLYITLLGLHVGRFSVTAALDKKE